MKYIIAIINLVIVILLFKRAAGGLKIGKLNIISYTLYSLLIFDFFGISLIYCGFHDHYLVNKVVDNPAIINKAYWVMVWVMIALPTTVIFSNKYIYKIANIYKRNERNIAMSTFLEDNKKQNNVYKICLVLLGVCFLSIVYVFANIGYIPLFKMLDSSFDFAVERINISRNFAGNEYIKNLVMMLLTPLISYLSYIYMRTTKEKKWIYLFAVSFILCLFVKTYDFSKGPLVYYIAYFFFVEIIIGNIKNYKKIFKYASVLVVLVVGMYLTIGKYNGNFISLSEGPISRTMITQSGTLLLHFDAFPEKTSYLMGHSFPRIAKIVFGDGEYGIRSGRKVMEIYNSKAIDDGTAGVMSTVFVGEAYANFGWVGVFIAPILVGIIASSIMCMFIKSKKTPLNICLYLEAIIIFATVLQAGFIDYIYNVSFAFILIYFAIINYCSDRNYFKNFKFAFFKREKMDLYEKNRMIFHIPNYIDLNRKSGSNIRPYKMIEAFKNIGYEVDVVMGYGKDRQQAIDEIENNILNGVKYDFMYSESSTMPTLLTEKHHLPTYPFLDFNFMKFCRRHEIKIGLFYRDIYWKFDDYKKQVSVYKRMISIPLYKYDLWCYKKLVNVLYLPSLKMAKIAYPNRNNLMFDALPPGISGGKKIIRKHNKLLNIMYVGGINKPGEIYDLTKLMSLTKIDKRVEVTICCRKNEWDSVKEYYREYLNNQIEIIHKSGLELDEYYYNADLCSLIFPYNEYRFFAMPIKLMEYLSYGKVVITTDKSAVSDYVKKNDVGFITKYDDKSIKKIINNVLNDKKNLIIKEKRIDKIIQQETWEARAKKVANDLGGLCK